MLGTVPSSVAIFVDTLQCKHAVCCDILQGNALCSFDVSMSAGTVTSERCCRCLQANSEVLDLNPWARLLGLSNLDTPPAEWLENQVFDLDDGFYGAYYEVYQFDDAVAFDSVRRSAPLSSPDSAGFLLARSADAEACLPAVPACSCSWLSLCFLSVLLCTIKSALRTVSWHASESVWLRTCPSSADTHDSCPEKLLSAQFEANLIMLALCGRLHKQQPANFMQACTDRLQHGRSVL